MCSVPAHSSLDTALLPPPLLYCCCYIWAPAYSLHAVRGTKQIPKSTVCSSQPRLHDASITVRARWATIDYLKFISQSQVNLQSELRWTEVSRTHEVQLSQRDRATLYQLKSGQLRHIVGRLAIAEWPWSASRTRLGRLINAFNWSIHGRSSKIMMYVTSC